MGHPLCRNQELSEWDGDAWREHSLPAGLDPSQVSYLCTDSLDRVWLLPDSDRSGPAAIFDPDAARWEVFSGYNGALQAQLGRSGFRLGGGDRMVSLFSADGRIFFLDLGRG